MSEFAIPVLNLLICVATDFEASALREQLPASHGVRLIQTGVGTVNAAHAVTVAILEHPPDAIVCCGVGGAYPSSKLRIGEVVCADVEVYGDLGAQSPSGFLDMQTLGFPVVDVGRPLFNELPMQIFPTARRVRFVTVSTCTGTETMADEMQTRTRGAIENMEGAAVAHVAHMHSIPVGEVRGVSNIATNRDKASWRLREASEAAQSALIEWISTLDPRALKASRP